MFRDLLSPRWALLRLLSYTLVLFAAAGEAFREMTIFVMKEVSILLGIGFAWPAIVFHNAADIGAAFLLLVVVPLLFVLRWIRAKSELWVLLLALHLNICIALMVPLNAAPAA